MIKVGSNLMEDEKMYTGGSYLDKNESWHVEDSPWKARQILKILDKNNIRPSTICEVGCGVGEILNQLHLKMPHNISFYGYEISPQAYKLAKTRQKDRLDFILKDLLEEARQFDVVLVIDVIEHIPDFYGFLKKLREKGAYKIFHIPLELSVQTVLRNKPILEGRSHVGHIHYFTKDTAIASLQDMGYTIIDSFYTAGMVELPGKLLRSKLLNWLRIVMFKMSKDLTVRILGGYSLMVLAK